MPIIEWTDFSGGMDQRPAFGKAKRGNAEELRNFFPNRYGRLERRPAMYTIFTMNTISHRSYRMYTRAGIVESPRLQANTLAIEFSLAALVTDLSGTVTEIKNFSYSPAQSHQCYYREQLWAPFLQVEDRVYYGLGATNNKHLSWIDQTSITQSPPEAYVLGHAAPSAAPSLALVSSVGDLTDTKYYGFAYTYYNNTYRDETIMSAKDNIQIADPNLRVRVTMRQIVDQGFDKCRIYMTDAHDSAADAVTGTYQLVGAVNMTNGTSTFTADVDASLLDGSAYTLGLANATDDHDVLTKLPVALAEYGGRIFALVDNAVRYCKRTTDRMYPEAWPVENELLIGNNSTRFTGLAALPSQEGLLIFSDRAIFLLRGAGPGGSFTVTTVAMSLGCPYLRTIATVGQLVYFLGTDNHVWATDGTLFQRVSDPVDTLLAGIKKYHRFLPVAGVFESQYWLSFPLGVFSSSTGGTIANGDTSIFSNTAPPDVGSQKITDTSAWSLSTVKVGQYVELASSPWLSSGFISEVDDGNDDISVEGYNQWSAGQVNVIVNNRTVVFDTEENWWTQYRDQNINSFAWFSIEEDSDGDDAQNLMTTRSTQPVQVAMHKDHYIDNAITQTPITCYFLSDLINLNEPSILRRFFLHFTDDSNHEVTFSVFVDGETSASVSKTFTPGQGTNRYSTGFFARCRQFQYSISYTAASSSGKQIERMGIEYTSITVQQ